MQKAVLQDLTQIISKLSTPTFTSNGMTLFTTGTLPSETVTKPFTSLTQQFQNPQLTLW